MVAFLILIFFLIFNKQFCIKIVINHLFVGDISSIKIYIKHCETSSFIKNATCKMNIEKSQKVYQNFSNQK